MNPSEATARDTFKNARRSTRLSRQIPILITSLDPEQSFCARCETVVVNAHGCATILPVRLKNKTPLWLELISNGRRKTAKIVLALSLVEGVSWFLGLEFDSPEGDFWGIENPPADWQL